MEAISKANVARQGERCSRECVDRCYFDIELSSLGRLENIVSVVVRRLLDESDAFVRRRVTLRLTMRARVDEHHHRRRRRRRRNIETLLPLLLSHVRISDRETPPSSSASMMNRCSDDEPTRRDKTIDRDDDSISSASSSVVTGRSTSEEDDGVTTVHNNHDIADDRSYDITDYDFGGLNTTSDRYRATKTTSQHRSHDNVRPSRKRKRRSTQDFTKHIFGRIGTSSRNDNDDDGKIVRLFERLAVAVTDETKIDNHDRLHWFVERFDKFDETVKRYRASRNSTSAIRQRLDTLKQLFLLPTIDDETASSPSSSSSAGDVAIGNEDWFTLHLCLFFQWFRLMSILPLEYNSKYVNFVWLSHSNVVRVFVCRRAFQTHVTSISTRQACLFGANDIVAAADDRRGCVDDRNIGFATANVTIAAATTTTDEEENDDVSDVVDIDDDDDVHETVAVDRITTATVSTTTRKCDADAMLSYDRPTEFVVSDGTIVITPESRVRQAFVDVILKDSSSDRALDNDYDGVGIARGKTSRCGASVSKGRRTTISSVFKEHDDYERRNDRTAAVIANITSEQKRVLLLLQNILRVSLFDENDSNVDDIDESIDADGGDSSSVTYRRKELNRLSDILCDTGDGGVSDSKSRRYGQTSAASSSSYRRVVDTMGAFCEKRQRSSNYTTPMTTPMISSPSSPLLSTPTLRRVIVDGVAGAGKTFMLGVLLWKFDNVRYLVKKRSFVDATLKRFHHHANLRAQTIDSYLMRHLGIRSLPYWLHKRKIDLDELSRQLRRNPVRADDRELIFVDEYSLIERSLANLLNLALVDRLVVLVGDCNQQPAIGDSTDQPVRTLLGYEHVCFMYDNVRTKDAQLLRRLSCFNARAEDTRFKAIQGLPLRRDIDMNDFFTAQKRDRRRLRNAVAVIGSLRGVNRSKDTASRFMPRVIVMSNAKVNYLNWAVGYMLMRHIRHNRRDRCLRYKRKIVVTSEAFRELVTMDKRETEWSTRAIAGTTEHMPFVDDAFADEQFVVVGARYRMIHALDSWPAQIGSRVVINEIISNDLVRVVTDDDRAIAFTVRKMRIKPYEYHSRWCALATAAVVSNNTNNGGGQYRKHATDRVRIHMFPFVMDAATTVYQVQGLTLEASEYDRCYIDVQGMDDKSLYVTLSRFQRENQIHGVINCHTLC